jgi:hypothetical protein
MQPFSPPAALTGSPVRHVLPAGTPLWRTHDTRGPAVAFDPPRDDVFGGRRFDGTRTSPHGCLYASPDMATAIAETVLPGFDTSPAAPRILTRASLADLALSEVRTTADLPLLRLTTATDLAAVHADSWLITERDGHYPAIRQWAGWLREHAPWAAGILWTSILDLPNTTLVLFEDMCTGSLAHVPASTRELGGDRPPDWLGEMLARWGVLTQPPPPRAPRVFLNYRSGSCDQSVLMLHNELSGRFGEQDVFRDVVSIPTGELFEPVLLDNAANTRVMLAVIGPGWETARDADDTVCLADPRDWVRREILHAWDHHVPVIPVLVGLRKRLREEDLPEPLRRLAGSQYMQLIGDADTTDISQFVDRLLRRRPELN